MKKLLLPLIFILAVGAAKAEVVINEAVTSTAVEISALPCNLMGYKVVNRDTSNAIFVHLYNALAANVTVGTTQQLDFIPVGAGGAVVIVLNDKIQTHFSTAFSIAITTSVLSSSSTAPGTAAAVSLVYGRNP